MNIAQTQQLLSFLWSKFPNSRTMTADDKRMTVLAYFDELWPFSLQDSINGARKALKAQPHFVPSAPEIAHYCDKTYDAKQYLSPEYDLITTQLATTCKLAEEFKPKHDAAFLERSALCIEKPESSMSESEKETYNSLTKTIDEYLNILSECKILERQQKRLLAEAEWRAADAYDAAERRNATNDFKSIGWAQPSIAIK